MKFFCDACGSDDEPVNELFANGSGPLCEACFGAESVQEQFNKSKNLVDEVFDDIYAKQNDLRTILSDETVDAWLDKLAKAVE